MDEETLVPGKILRRSLKKTLILETGLLVSILGL